MIRVLLVKLVLLAALVVLLIMAVCCVLFGFDYNGATVLAVTVAALAGARLAWYHAQGVEL
ncbi:hypothetical protein [Cryobacterium cryoconiti]|uniref:hypothetical protein n=1 Tax=Cryobacterium cryoconiti TaxID=1259239 RepID=UPI001F543750|nr:hypothetical protein [Cryobacterium cryoconiti]